MLYDVSILVFQISKLLDQNRYLSWNLAFLMNCRSDMIQNILTNNFKQVVMSISSELYDSEL
jgi:hypothetical protein